MKIFSVVGARPQFIKLGPLSKVLEAAHEEIIVHTGQHYDYAMSEKIFEDLGIRKPDIHLSCQTGSHAVATADMMVKLEKAMLETRPDMVVIFGDTNSTLAGALAAAKINIPITHIEAGLRSYNRTMPEEINRIVADHTSQYLFAPTQTAMDILKSEGLASISYFTGDIMVDSVKAGVEAAKQKSDILNQLRVKDQNFYLLTLHRNYNVDDPVLLKHILEELQKLDIQIIFPVHPRTRKMLAGLGDVPSNFLLTEPLGYLDFLMLQTSAGKIVTDSGGIQKEAYLLNKPCITLRTETEWVETVRAGWNLLLEPSSSDIAQKISNFSTPSHQEKIFGEHVAMAMKEIIDTL